MKLSKGLTNAVILALAVIMMAGCGGAESRKAKYIERGKDYLAQKNYDKARVEFKNVIQIDPKSAEGYYHLGWVEQSSNNLKEAFSYYMKALELSPDYRDVQLRLARFYLAGGNSDKAREIADAILAKNPADADGRVLNAAIFAVKGATSDAIKEVSAVLETDPGHSDALDLLSSIYATKGQVDKAIEVLEKRLAVDKESVMLRLRLAQLYADRKDLAKAETMLKEVVTLQPEVLQNRTNLALFYSRTGQPGKAKNVLLETIQADPEDPRRHLLLTDFLASQKDYDAAEKQLIAAIKDIPKESQLRFGLASIYQQMNLPDKMENTYREIISLEDTAPDGLKARNYLANLLLLQGKKLDEIVQLNNEVLKANHRDNDALIIKGRIALIEKNPQDAINAFRTVLKDQPANVIVLTLLAEAHLANGEKELTRDNLLKALEFEPKNAKARANLVKYYLGTGNIVDATKAIDEGLKLESTNLELLLAKADLYAAKKDTKETRKIFETIKAKHPDSPAGYYRSGQLFMVEGKYDQALREFETAWKKSSDGEILVAIVNTHMAQGKPDKAIQRLNEVMQQSPRNALVHEMLGEVYASQRNHVEAEAQFRKAIELSPGWTQPYGNLAKLLQSRGDLPGSISVYEQGLKAAPDDVILMLYLGAAYERTENYEKGIEVYERILEKDPNNAIAANNLASLLCDRRTDKKSFERARELAERFQSVQQPYFQDTLGWAYYRNDDTDKAIEVLGKVVSELPDVAIFRYHLGMAYYKKGDLDAARNHLRKAVAGKDEFSGKAEAQSVLQKIQ